MGACVCVGNHAENPYRFEELGINVFSMEELCYVCVENSFLLDSSIMDDRLVDWVDRECGVKELARELYRMVHQKGSLSAFVGMILEYVGLYGAERIREVGQALKKGAGLSNLEKRKSRVDYLVGKKKYAAALREYDILLAEWEAADQAGKLPGAKLRSNILYNKGVAFTGLMCYGQAAECFLLASRLEGGEGDFDAYLAAKRMELEEGDYITFAAEMPENLDASLALERTMERLKRQWRDSPGKMRLEQRRELRENGGKQKYYDDNERLIQALKSGYRSSVAE